MKEKLDDIARIDSGGMDWYVGRDDDGNIWITPALSWSDGQVYESLRDGQGEIYYVLSKFREL